VQSNQDRADQELLDLAQETERVAATIADAKCAARLTEIAAEVRSMAIWLQHTDDEEANSWIFRPVA